MFKSLTVKPGRAPLIVVGLVAGTAKLPRSLASLDKAADGVLSRALSSRSFKADAGETVAAGPKHMLVGLGKKADLKPETLRTIGARLVKALDRQAPTAPSAVKLVLADEIPDSAGDARTAGRCVGEGMGLANWRVDFFDGKATNRKPANKPLAIDATDARFRAGVKDGLALAASVNVARRLAATPPNICTPAWMLAQARKLAREKRLRCRVIDFRRAQRLGMGGLVNVGKGSAAKPCLIVLEYKPRGSSARPRLALVGKTVTYDTGGYSLKVNNGMKGMKYDKCGGCAVLGAMHAIASMKLPVHVVALLPAAENMVSDVSYRPDDIIQMYNGVSVEVTNTDAEGRLVLADALAYACRDLEPEVIVDLATLTGGIVTALGHFCSGVFCNDESLMKRVNRAAETSGEKVWPMPLWKEHKEFMRAQHADILNSNPSRNAHPVQGAAFLGYFVDEKIPWAHLDIAGVASVESDKDLYCTGPTGYGVRLLADLAAGFGRG